MCLGGAGLCRKDCGCGRGSVRVRCSRIGAGVELCGVDLG